MTDAFLNAAARELGDAVIEHSSPGRLRLRIRSRRGDAGYFRRLVSLISECPAVEEITANPETGGILIRHAPAGGQIQRLTDLIEPAAPRTREGKRSLPPLAFEAGELAAGAFLVLAVLQLGRGRVAGNAVEQLWHLYLAARKLGLPQLAPVLAALTLIQLSRGRFFPPASTLIMYALMLRGQPVAARPARGPQRASKGLLSLRPRRSARDL